MRSYSTKFTVDVEIEDSEMIAEISKSYNPEDVFSFGELSQWAKENGYIVNPQEDIGGGK